MQSVMHKQVAIPFGTRNHLSRNLEIIWITMEGDIQTFAP